MSWNGSGTYSLPALYFPEAPGNLVDSARYNGTLNDIATGLNVALARDGQNAATANLPMGGFKHTGAVAAAGTGEYLLYGQTGASLAAPAFTGVMTAEDITTTGSTTLGNATSDTLNVGNGGIIKDASNNVGFGITTAAGINPNNGVTLNGITSNTQVAIGHPTGTLSGTTFLNFNYDAAAIGNITQSGTTAVAYNTTSLCLG